MFALIRFNGLEDGSGHHGNASFIMQPVLQVTTGCPDNRLPWDLNGITQAAVTATHGLFNCR